MKRISTLRILVFFMFLVACAQEAPLTDNGVSIAVSSPSPTTPAALLATKTPQPTMTTAQNPTTVSPETNEPPLDLLELKATPTRSPSATSTPDPDAILITEEPIFVGGDVRLQGWSPDGRYLAYFEYTAEQIAQTEIPGNAPGTFTFFDTVTGQKCQRYPLDGRFPYEGPEYGFRFTWLPVVTF